MEHAAGDVRHGQYIGIGKVAGDVALAEHLADIEEEGLGQFREFREPADGDQFHGLARQPFLQAYPYPTGFLLVGGYVIETVAEQGQGIACLQQLLGLFMEGKGIEHGGEKPVHRSVEGVDRHSPKSSFSCCSSAARFCCAFEMSSGRRRSGWSSLMPTMGTE